MKTDRSTSLHLNLLKALDPLALLLKGGEGSGPHPGPEQSNAADNAWDTRGRKGEEGKKGRGPKGDGKRAPRRKGEGPLSIPSASTGAADESPRQKNPQKAVNSSSKTLKDSVKNPSLVKTVERLGHAESGRAATYRVTFKDGTMGIYKPTHATGLEMGFDKPPTKVGVEEHKFETSKREDALRAFKKVSSKYESEEGYQMSGGALKLAHDASADVWRTYRAGRKGDEFQISLEMLFDPQTGNGVITATQYETREYTEARSTVDKSVPEKSREMAAYKISEAMGLNIVPQIEFVDYGEGKGHVQGFVNGEDACTEKAGKQFDADIRSGHPDIHRVAALDVLLGNTDRHWGNLRRGEDGRWYAIDNGLAIPDNTHHYEFLSEVVAELMEVGLEDPSLATIPKEVRREIQAIDPATLEKILHEQDFLREDIQGCLTRLAALKKMRKWPVNKKYYDKKADRFDPRRFMQSIKAKKKA
jgi:hypothetical protein